MENEQIDKEPKLETEINQKNLISSNSSQINTSNPTIFSSKSEINKLQDISNTKISENNPSNSTQNSLSQNLNEKAKFKERYDQHIQSLVEKNRQKKETNEKKLTDIKSFRIKLQKKLGFDSAQSKIAQNMHNEEHKQESAQKIPRTCSVDNGKKKKKKAPKTSDPVASTKIPQSTATKANTLASTQSKEDTQQQQIRGYIPHVYDIEQWKRRNRLDPKTKVFIVSSIYPDIKDSLLSRGWVENPDVYSPCFDLKWVLQSQMVDMPLKDEQIVNHYEKNREITTKVGLLYSLKELRWFVNEDINVFYPKCFDLKEEHEREMFVYEYKLQKAESILKNAFLQLLKNELKEDVKDKIKVAIKVIKNHYKGIDEIIEQKGKQTENTISEKDWEVLSGGDLTKKELDEIKHKKILEKIEKGAMQYYEGDPKKKKEKKEEKKS